MLNILLLIISYLFIEFVAWSNHKYIMHSFLWKWQKDHHRKDYQHTLPEKTEDKRFEKTTCSFWYNWINISFLRKNPNFYIRAVIKAHTGLTIVLRTRKIFIIMDY